jgi:hypothetical protein
MVQHSKGAQLSKGGSSSKVTDISSTLTINKPVLAQTWSDTAAAISTTAETMFVHQCWANSVAHPVTGAAMEY